MSIRGPYYRSTPPIGASGNARYHQEKWKWEGPFPRPPLPYRVGFSDANGYWNLVNLENYASAAASAASGQRTRCYDKFWGTAVKRASLGVSLVESGSSLAMIAKRLNTLRDCWKFLRHGNFRALNRALGVSQDFRPKTRRRRDLSDLGSAWLEYTFGWAPLVQDVYDSVNVLQQDFGFFRHKVKVTEHAHVGHAWDGGPDPEDYGSSFGGTFEQVYYYGARVRVDNPNLLLANSLGLINPATVLWEVIPFSFVVDWFIPVGQFLRNMSHTAGLTITHAFHGWGIKLVNGYAAHGPRKGPSRGPARHYSGQRFVGDLPPPSIASRIQIPKLDPWLALTSFALFAQAFGKK